MSYATYDTVNPSTETTYEPAHCDGSNGYRETEGHEGT